MVTKLPLAADSYDEELQCTPKLNTRWYYSCVAHRLKHEVLHTTRASIIQATGKAGRRHPSNSEAEATTSAAAVVDVTARAPSNERASNGKINAGGSGWEAKGLKTLAASV